MIQESSGFYRFVSNTEPFRDLLKDWRDDDIFAEQRLSGCNPMVLRRVTDDSCELRLYVFVKSASILLTDLSYFLPTSIVTARKENERRLNA